MAIHFFSAEIPFRLSKPNKKRNWIKSVFKAENKKLGSLTYIFCSDDYLSEINSKYLNHKSFTDIITFDLSNSSDNIVGEVYISIERVTENSKKFKTSFETELHRVMVHGVLHLCGYNDKTNCAGPRPTRTRSLARKPTALSSLGRAASESTPRPARRRQADRRTRPNSARSYASTQRACKSRIAIQNKGTEMPADTAANMASLNVPSNE